MHTFRRGGFKCAFLPLDRPFDMRQMIYNFFFTFAKQPRQVSYPLVVLTQKCYDLLPNGFFRHNAHGWFYYRQLLEHA